MISLFRYRIPFIQPFKLAGSTIQDREGIIVRYGTDTMDVYSEIAPLIGFSEESTYETLEILISRIDEIDLHLKDPNTDSWYDWMHGCSFHPSIRFGLDILRLRSFATKTGTALHTSLNPKASDRVGTNAVLGVLPSNELIRQSDQLVKYGYRTVKYKISNPETNIEAWERLRAQYPHLNMRFDANGSWPIEEADKWAKLLERVGPEYLEQPLAVGLESRMASLQRELSYPLAFDESARNIESVRSILAESPESVLILKPMLIGTVRELTDIITEIKAARSAFTITTLLESGIGRNAVATLATAFANTDVDHGLGTGSLFAKDILVDKNIIQGFFDVDTNPFRHINTSFLETFRVY
jgi:o-succinylbenzoate synthase